MATNDPDYMRQWREAHPDKVASYRKKFNATHDTNEMSRKYYQDHQDAMKEKARRYRQTNKARIKRNRLRSRYGEVKYDEMFTKQEGRCAICGRHQSELPKALCVDHVHNTGEIRALLCSDCNLGIGSFFDNPDLLILAAEYLKSNDGVAII